MWLSRRTNHADFRGVHAGREGYAFVHNRLARTVFTLPSKVRLSRFQQAGPTIRTADQTGDKTMTANRFNALFASTLATVFTFAFVLVSMPANAILAGGLA